MMGTFRVVAAALALATVAGCSPNVKTSAQFVDNGKRDYVIQTAFVPGRDLVAARVFGTRDRTPAGVRKARKRFERVAATAMATECRKRGLTASARGLKGTELRRFVARGRVSHWVFGRFCV